MVDNFPDTLTKHLSISTYKFVVFFLVRNAIGDAVSRVHEDLPENALLTSMDKDANEIHGDKHKNVRAELEGQDGKLMKKRAGKV